MSGLTIRPAQPGDGRDLARIWIEIGRRQAQLDLDWVQLPELAGLVEWLEAMLEKPRADDHLWSVGQLDGRLIGYIYAHVVGPIGSARWQVLSELAETRLVIDAVGVEVAYQRRGVGTQLVRTAEEWAKVRGARLATVETWVSSPLSMPFY